MINFSYFVVLLQEDLAPNRIAMRFLPVFTLSKNPFPDVF